MLLIRDNSLNSCDGLKVTTNTPFHNSRRLAKFMMSSQSQPSQVAPPTARQLRRFSLELTPQDFDQLCENIITQLKRATDDALQTADLAAALNKWQEAEGVAAIEATVFVLASMVHPNKEVRTKATNAKQKLKDTWDSIYANEKAYIFFSSSENAIPHKTLQSAAASEDVQQLERLHRQMLKKFQRQGLGLDSRSRDKYRALRQEIVALENTFQQNINEDMTCLWFTIEQLHGCPDSFVTGLETRTNEVGPVTYKVTLKPPHVLMIMKFAVKDSTRRKLLEASQSRCQDVNLPILARLITARHEAAKLLGFNSHAEYMLDINMARTPQNAEKFLRRVLEQIVPSLHNDINDLKDIKKQITVTGQETILNLWDISYCEQLLRKQKYAVDEQKVKEYFSLDKVLPEMLSIFQELLHLHFVEIHDSSLKWDDQVRLFSIYDRGSSEDARSPHGDLLGFFYLDLFSRDGKYSHQCVVPLSPSCILSTGKVLPVVVNIGNLPKPTATTPSLLSHSEVVTTFHELGHALHAILTKSQFLQFSWSWSVNPYPAGVEMDFLEVPSQLLENWIRNKDILKRLSSHYVHGDTMPNELIEGIVKIRHVNNGYKYSRQIFMSLYDLIIHSAEFMQNGNDIKTLEQRLRTLWNELQHSCTTLEPIPSTSPMASWYHIAMGYDAGYYSYLWAEVYAHDLFTKFKSAPMGCLDTNVGNEYRTCILEKGATVDAMDMMRNFLKRDVSEEAFLDCVLRRGS